MTSHASLYVNAAIRTPALPSHATESALLVRDGVVAWVGSAADAPAADEVIDCRAIAGDDALLAPAFVDAHVHATDTGLALRGLDLSGVRSAEQLLDAVSAFAAGLPDAAVVLGHGFDESTWPSLEQPPAAERLARASGGRAVYLSQASIHSALVTPDLLKLAEGAPGYDESGWVRRDAHHVVREAAFGQITADQRRTAQRAALEHAASLGIAAVHECGGPGTSSEEDFTDVLSLSGAGLPEVYGYWGELGGAAKAVELGAVGAGGDLYADGALGSRTAHLSADYLDEHGCGFGYVTAEQVRDHLLGCHALRPRDERSREEPGVHSARPLQGGFHAIGDAAIGTVLEGFAMAAAKLGHLGVSGAEVLREARHRIEHAEIVDKAMIGKFVEYGITASMQPAFDRLWGGEHQMYAQRLGVARSLASNPMGQMHAVGVALAFGSDSPVTPLDPWGSVRAAVNHFNPVQRMSAKAAYAAHTRGGWRAVHLDDDGVLAPGHAATFGIWSAPGGLVGTLPALLPELPDEPLPELPVCRRTVLRGEKIYG
ncbi:amidohydrolase [Hamadaea tsunoensis]|uniref:amidohydrolase n=1 Tax=Hamadaea tsunoensis TaxID=53368 RepID=UPI000487C064|nr:amidohydrolase family protein [Hamadaea tsunoensis]